jgi:hypothetical protein
MSQNNFERDRTYIEYCNYIKTLIATKELSIFKCNSNYTHVLEHVNYEQGQQYYNLIKNEFNTPDMIILEFCNLNDKIGNPKQFDYSFGKSSPTSLRYIYHTLLTISHISKIGQNSIKIIEIGGGYGGLAFALQHFCQFFGISIESYTMIDLTEPVALQELYLSKVADISKFKFYNADNYGKEIEGNNYYLLSMYSLGEIAVERQLLYFNTLLPKVSHGFLVWNTLPYPELNYSTKREIERPLTGPHNQFIFF